MPWKNGQGATTELLIDPPGATLAGGFLWRLSMADVAESGPFSAFPGLDRTLMLLSGGGMELDHGDQGRQVLARPLEPVSFSGDWTTQGRLLAGPCKDFNVLSARGKIRHELTVLELGPAFVALPDAPRLLVYCVRGPARVAGVLLEENHLLDLDEATGTEARAAAGAGAVLALVEIVS